MVNASLSRGPELGRATGSFGPHAAREAEKPNEPECRRNRREFACVTVPFGPQPDVGAAAFILARPGVEKPKEPESPGIPRRFEVTRHQASVALACGPLHGPRGCRACWPRPRQEGMAKRPKKTEGTQGPQKSKEFAGP